MVRMIRMILRGPKPGWDEDHLALTGEEGAGGADQGPKADNIYVLTEITYGVRCFYMHLFI